jgi:hypothetical protein
MPSKEQNKYKDKLTSIEPDIDYDAGWDAIADHLDKEDDNRKPVLWWRFGIIIALVLVSTTAYLLNVSPKSLSDISLQAQASTTSDNQPLTSNDIADGKESASRITDHNNNNNNNANSPASLTADPSSKIQNLVSSKSTLPLTLNNNSDNGPSVIQYDTQVQPSAIMQPLATQAGQTSNDGKALLPSDTGADGTTANNAGIAITELDETFISPLLPISIELLLITTDDLPTPSYQSPLNNTRPATALWSLNQGTYTPLGVTSVAADGDNNIRTAQLLSSITSLQYHRTMTGRWSWSAGLGYQVQRQRQRANATITTVERINTADGTIVINDTGSVIGTLPGTATRETTITRDIQQYGYIHSAVVQAGIGFQWSDRWRSEVSAIYTAPVYTSGNAIEPSLDVSSLSTADIPTDLSAQINLLYRLPLRGLRADVGATSLHSVNTNNRSRVGLYMRLYL